MLEFVLGVLALVGVCLGWLGYVVLTARVPRALAWVERLRGKDHRMEFLRFLRSLSRVSAGMAGLFLFSFYTLGAFAGPFDALQGFFDIALTLLVVGIIAAIVGFVLREWAGRPGEAIGSPILLIGAIVAILGIAGIGVGYVNAWMGGAGPRQCPGGQILDPATNQCTTPTEYVADWDCNFVTLAAGGPGGAHDATSEFPDTPFIAADGGTPDYDSTIATPVYTGGKLARIDITVDDEANAVAGTGSNANVWLNEDAYAFDVNCKLDNAPQAVGGGLATQPLWAKWSVPYTTGQAGNMTDDGVFVCDSSNGGVYLGFGNVADAGQAPAGHDADHTYTSYQKSTSCATPPTQGEWTPVGFTSTTTPQDGQWVAPWFVLNVGILSYEDTTVTYSMQIQIGTEPGNPDYRGNIETLRIDLIATDD